MNNLRAGDIVNFSVFYLLLIAWKPSLFSCPNVCYWKKLHAWGIVLFSDSCLFFIQISLAKVKYLILDEADRMLDMGFEPEIRRMIETMSLPAKEDRQTLMFSATFPEQIQKLAGEFLNDYLFVTVGRVGGANTDIEQQVFEVDSNSKREKLVSILNETGIYALHWKVTRDSAIKVVGYSDPQERVVRRAVRITKKLTDEFCLLAPTVTVGETEGAMDSASILFFTSSFAYNFARK